MLRDVHKGVPDPEDPAGIETLVQGNYEYYHYCCDGFNDQGWGCGYRTLQTLCSWIRLTHRAEDTTPPVPAIPAIQAMLVAMEDKPADFINSKQWIGSIEASYVLSHLYDWDSRIIHVASGSALGQVTANIAAHFSAGGGPVMAGGDMDCSSKCIVGVRGEHLLVVDPHFCSPRAKSAAQLHSAGWVRWHKIDEFLASSFYNLCLPLPPARK